MARMQKETETNEKNSLYTFQMEWRGGTYLSQFYAGSVRHAIKLWVDALDIKILKIRQATKEKVKSDLASENYHFVPIDGLKNVWGFGSLISDDLARLYIVKTKYPPTLK